MAAVVLARQTSAQMAAGVFHIDQRTIGSWMRTVAVPESEWGAIEQTLLARGAEMTARGEVRGLVQTLTGAGIASRNARYEQLIARREARRAEQDEAEPAGPIRDWSAEIRAMTPEQLTDLYESAGLGPPDLTAEDPVIALRDAIDAVDGPAGDGVLPPPPVVLVEDGSPEGVRMREAKDVTPGAPEPPPEPKYRSETLHESPIDAPGVWEAWRRYEL